MYNLICCKKGLTLVEVLIAIVLTTVGILALLSLQPTAYSLAGKSEHLSRAAGILSGQLDTIEALISNPCNNVTAGSAGYVDVGNITYYVTSTITPLPNATSPTNWLVRVSVTGPGNTTGIRESRVVTRQESFRFPADCTTISP